MARIKVGNWLAEDLELMKTYYEATVLQCFKGKMPSEFTLLQDGCSKGTFKGYPLFTHGNELLVFMKKSTSDHYSSPYWIMGAFTTLMDVAYDQSGNRYFADAYGILGATIQDATNYAKQDAPFAEIYAKLSTEDPIVAESSRTYPYVFAESDLTKILDNCLAAQDRSEEGDQY